MNLDFSSFNIEDKVNGKPKTKEQPKKNVISPIRSTEELPKTKPKVEMKNFNISMYKQVYQYCDKCEIETVQFLKESCANCMYCNHKTSYGEYVSTLKVVSKPISLNYHNFILI